MSAVNTILTNTRRIAGGPTLFQKNLVPYNFHNLQNSNAWTLEASGSPSFFYFDKNRAVEITVPSGSEAVFRSALIPVRPGVGHAAVSNIFEWMTVATYTAVMKIIDGSDEYSYTVEGPLDNNFGRGIFFTPKTENVRFELQVLGEDEGDTVVNFGHLMVIPWEGWNGGPASATLGHMIQPGATAFLNKEADNYLGTIQEEPVGGEFVFGNNANIDLTGINTARIGCALVDRQVLAHLTTGVSWIDRLVEGIDGLSIAIGGANSIGWVDGETVEEWNAAQGAETVWSDDEFILPEFILVMYGFRDLHQGVPSGSMIGAMTGTLMNVAQNTKRILLCTLPTFPQYDPVEAQAYNDHVMSINGTIVGPGAPGPEAEVVSVDVAKLLNGSDGFINPEYYTPDASGGTINPKGQAIIANAVRNSVIKAISPPPPGDEKADYIGRLQASVGDKQFDSSGAYNNDRESPAIRGYSVTPSDSDDLPSRCDAIYVGTAGNLTITLIGMEDGESITISDAGVGYHPLSIKRVWATGTTAADLVAVE